MNVVGGLYILAWMMIWLGLLKVAELTWRGSKLSETLGFFTG